MVCGGVFKANALNYFKTKPKLQSLMCGRYSFVPTQKQLAEQLPGLDRPAELRLRFNIAPTHQAYVITNEQPRLLQSMEWGLVPHWSKDGLNQGKRINARAEGIEEKPSFREPIRRQRCLVPADGFYEWRSFPGKRKVPYRILPVQGGLLFMAGIWDVWGSGAERRHTFSIITTAPSRDVVDLHNRMPVILPDAESQRRWLEDIPLAEVLSLLRPAPEGTFRFYRVSEKLNQAGYDQPDLHTALPDEPTLFG